MTTNAFRCLIRVDVSHLFKERNITPRASNERRRRRREEREEREREIQLHETTAHKHVNYNAIDRYHVTNVVVVHVESLESQCRY